MAFQLGGKAEEAHQVSPAMDLLRTLPLLLLTALMAGCSDDGGANPDGDASGAAASAAGAMLPENFTASETVAASVMGAPVPAPAEPPAGLPYCAPPTSMCYYYPFVVNGTADVTVQADLAWMVPAHDFDIFMADGDDAQLAGDFAYPPADTATLTASIGPGAYYLGVVAYFAAADQFTLNVGFSA